MREKNQQNPSKSNIRYSYSFFDKFSIQSKAANSNDIILRNRESKQLILMKQIQVNPDEYEQTLATLQYEKRLSHEQLLSLVDYHPQPSNIKFIVLYQYCDITLMNQFQNRVHQHRYFEESELWSIFTSLIFGLAYLQEQNVGHGSISLYDSFLNEQGFIKICDPTAATSNPYNVAKGYYYSPEILRCLVHETGQQINIFKNDVFALGCCLLQLTLMKDITEIFNYEQGVVGKAKLNNFLQQLQCHNLSQLFVRVLKQTLELDLANRPDFVDLKTQIFQMINEDKSQNSQKLRGSIEIKSSISSLYRSKGQPNINIRQIYKTQISDQKSKESASKANQMILTFSQIGMISDNGITLSKSSGRQMLSQFLRTQPNVDYLFGNLKKSIHLSKQQSQIEDSMEVPEKQIAKKQQMELTMKEIMNMKQSIQQIESNLQKRKRQRESMSKQNRPSDLSEYYTPSNRNQQKKQPEFLNLKQQQKALTVFTDCTSKRVSSQISFSPKVAQEAKKKDYPAMLMNNYSSPYLSGYEFITINKNNSPCKTHCSFITSAKEQKLRMLKQDQTYTNPDFLKMMQADVQQILHKRKIL